MTVPTGLRNISRLFLHSQSHSSLPPALNAVLTRVRADASALMRIYTPMPQGSACLQGCRIGRHARHRQAALHRLLLSACVLAK